MPNLKDIAVNVLQDGLGLTLVEPIKYLIEIARLCGLKLAIPATVLVVFFFHYMEWNLLVVGTGRRVAIKMITTPPTHELYNRTADVVDVVNELNRLTRSNPKREVHVVISGCPGAGKSELARQVGEKIFHSENKRFFNFDLSFILPPTDVITLNAENENQLQSTLEEAVDKLQGKDPKPMGYNSIGDEKTIFAKFYQLRVALRSRSSLSSHPVIIFDNVKGPMCTFLYKKRANGKYFLRAGNNEYGEIRIIVTTQHRPTVMFRSVMGYKDMFEPMPTDEAVKLLNTITNIQNDDQNARYLAYKLGGLPKSLADAAIYIQMDKRYNASYRFYLEELELKKRQYLDNVGFSWAKGRDWGLSYDFTAFTASLMLVEQYFQDSSHGHFYEALAFFVGYCGSPVISMNFLVKYVDLVDVLKDYSEFQVKTLVRETSLYDVKTSNPDLISTHQITRYALFDAWNKKMTNKNDQSDIFETSIARIFEVLESELTSKHDLSTNQMVEYTSLSFKVVDVIMSLVTKMREKQLNLSNVIKKEFCWVFLDSITEAYLYWPNNHKSAVVMPEVEFLVDMVEESFEKGNVEIALLLSVLFFHNTGNQAPRSLERIVKMNENFARDSLSNTDEYSVEKTALLINMIGTVYRGLAQNLSKAREFHQLALDLSERYKLKNEKATSLHLLGIIHRYESDLHEARSCHEQAVELGRQIFSPKENGRLAAFLLNQAVVYSRLREFDKARQVYEETLELVRKAYGSRDQRVARVLNTLSVTYSSLGKYHESVEVLSEALSIHEEIHGDFHPNVGETLYFLGFTYRAKGDLQKSLQTLSRSLGIMQQYYGDEHYHFAEVLHDLSNTQRELNMLNDALESAKRCVDIFRKTLQENSSGFATSLNGLGLTYLALGDPITAQTKFEEALGVFEELQKQGFQGVSISETYKNLAVALKHRGETEKAKEYVSSALDIILKVHSESHPRVKQLRELEKDLDGSEESDDEL